MAKVSSPLDKKHLKKAVDALLTHVENTKSKGKAQLVDFNVPVIVQVATSSIPEGRNKPYMITLKHPMYDPEDTQTCLITKDPQREYKDKIAQQGITNISRVIGVTKLRTKFKQYEAQRQLCASYDLFLADDRVLPLLPHLIGKVFFQKKKQPLPVNLQKGKWGEQFKRMLMSTPLYLSEGSCTSIKAGHTGMTAAQLVDNIIIVAEKLASVLPKQWKGVQAIHIKTHDSVALPIFHSLPSADELSTEAETKKRKGSDSDGAEASPAKKRRPAPPKKEQPQPATAAAGGSSKAANKGEKLTAKTPIAAKAITKETPKKALPKKEATKKQAPTKEVAKKEVAKKEVAKKEAPAKVSAAKGKVKVAAGAVKTTAKAKVKVAGSKTKK